MKQEYRLIVSEDKESLEKEVNELLSTNTAIKYWKLYGSPFTSYSSFCQALEYIEVE